MTSRGFPDTSEPAIGRFALLHPGYLDSLIYQPGRWVSAAGRVAGQISSTHDALRPLPLIHSLELKLLPEQIRDYPPFHIGVGVMFGF
jgi:outer membrane lipoprotein